MPRGDDDETPIDVEVSNDSLDTFRRSASARQRSSQGLDPEAMQAGFKMMQEMDRMQQEQQVENAFRKQTASPAAPSIPWFSIVTIGVGLGIVTGKLNIFTLIGEAVSGVVVAVVALPLVAFVGVQLFFKTQTLSTACPVCDSEVTLFKSQAIPCLNCGTVLVIEDGKAVRAGDFNTEVDEQTGRTKSVRDVYDVDASVVDDSK